MSREYVAQRLSEFGAVPRLPAKPVAQKPVAKNRPVWPMPGVRKASLESPLLVCDCHPDLQGTANNYVKRARSISDSATWFDVRNAFIIGYHLALEDKREP
jgi:hypothetical protein